MRGYKVFSGTANQELSRQIAKYLGIPLSEASIKRCSDGEISILMTQFVGPYRPAAPVKSANKSEAEADEEINFTVHQYFPSQVYANSSLVTGAYLLFDDFYGYPASKRPQNYQLQRRGCHRRCHHLDARQRQRISAKRHFLLFL